MKPAPCAASPRPVPYRISSITGRVKSCDVAVHLTQPSEWRSLAGHAANEYLACDGGSAKITLQTLADPPRTGRKRYEAFFG